MSKRGKTGLRKGKPKAGLTPAEQQRVAEMVAADRRRWQVLFAMNAWTSTPAEVAKHSVKVEGGRP